MKKQLSKLTLKTDLIIALTKNQAQSMKGGRAPNTYVTQCGCSYTSCNE